MVPPTGPPHALHTRILVPGNNYLPGGHWGREARYVGRPRLEDRKETMLAYVEHEGPYNDMP